MIVYSNDGPKQNGVPFPDLLYQLTVIHVKNFTTWPAYTYETKYSKIICENVTFFLIQVPARKLEKKKKTTLESIANNNVAGRFI